MGTAIHAHQGRIDKYMGDGIMAIFGLNSDEETISIHPAQQTYQAALDMLKNLKHFNRYLQKHIMSRLRLELGFIMVLL